VRIVVDTNIVFSALMNADNLMGEVLLNLQDELFFYSPELLRLELFRYANKLQKASKLTEEQLGESSIRIMERITLVSEELISEKTWIIAYGLTKDVDEDDTPFVALALEMGAKLWTGDRKLTTGLIAKGSEIVVSTRQLADYLKDK